MYLQAIFFLTALISSGFASEHDHHDKSVLRLHNFTGDFPVDKMEGVEEVCLEDSTITLPIKAYDFPQVKKSISKRTKFIMAPESKPLTSPNVETIIMDTIDLEQHGLHGFKEYTHLKTLDIKNVKLGNVVSNSLDKQKNLKSMKLVSAGITGFEKDAFNGLDNLEHLDLSDNHLKTIAKEVLAPLKKLKTLVLRRNQFEKFGAENIPVLPELTKIDLGTNPVDSVDIEGLKKVAPKLDSLLIGATD